MVAGGPPVWQQGGRRRGGAHAAEVVPRLRRIERIAHHRLRRLEPVGEEEGGEGILRHRAPRLLATDAGEEGRVCHLGAVCVNTLYASDVDLLLGKPRSSELERCAVQLHRLAGRHGRRPNCSGLHVARPKGPP